MGAASECRDAPPRRFYTHRRGPVAQSVEQGTFNPKVTGSIPVRPINAPDQRLDIEVFL